MKAKNKRQSMREQDIQKIRDDAVAEYKEMYEWHILRLICGDDCYNELVNAGPGPSFDAAVLYNDHLYGKEII